MTHFKKEGHVGSMYMTSMKKMKKVVAFILVIGCFLHGPFESRFTLLHVHPTNEGSL